ncbi:hypothetical protein EJ03DRAFT_327535 [Teratosphaeria nubilosa]|uniref:G-patch domain-containing protein n=1 Tax=Teratosphaeria nubilosa TaxID=161662 RepID=A0A6G1L8K1_9PEZI|nr:hypothetical protein EJ03DRAFT_327535 [Teratosphaeria nubilosa]
MGLAGQKKRSKLSQDPNNTTWAKSTTNFGHRILSQHGWKPGDYLGAEHAAHQAHYTAANASHIQVMLREDGLGLGAEIGGAGNADTFGLRLLSGVFGRLNGKSEGDVQQQQQQQQQERLRDAGLRSWQAQKYGVMNFVSGGLLVGDKVEVDAKMPADQSAGKKRKSDAVEETSKKKSRKGQVEVDERKKSKKTKANPLDSDPRSTASSDASQDDAASAKAKRKAAKKARREPKERRRAETPALQHNPDSSKSATESKAERRARKDERRKRKEQRRAKTSTSTPASASAPPSDASTNPPPFAGSRHAVRHRYIQQKRLASMDAKALNEILMIKA